MKTKIVGYRRVSSYRSHNLEVVGSSPTWSTPRKAIQALTQNVSAFLFDNCSPAGEQREFTYACRVLRYPQARTSTGTNATASHAKRQFPEDPDKAPFADYAGHGYMKTIFQRVTPLSE